MHINPPASLDLRRWRAWGDNSLYTGPKRPDNKQQTNQIISQVREGHIALGEALQLLSGKGSLQQTQTADSVITKEKYNERSLSWSNWSACVK